MPKKNVLIHLHVYYREQLDRFIDRIKAINNEANMSLVVSVNENDFIDEKIISKVMRAFPDARILQVSNKGFDVGPFIEALKGYDLDRFDYVIKLHTKSRGKEGRTMLNDIVISNSLWEDIMIDALIGSKERFHEALRVFDDEKTGMAAASMCIIRDDESRRSYYFLRVNDELKKMGLKPVEEMNDLEFVAGTMFIIRAELLKPLSIYSIDDFGINYPGIHDCTLAHCFERLFAGLIKSQGFVLRGLESRPSKIELCKLERMRIREEKANSGESLIGDARTFFSKLCAKIAYRFAKEQIIKNSEFFNARWYRWRYLKKDKIGMRPEQHYLLYGYKMGYKPSPPFNGSQYIAYYPDLWNLKMNPLLHYEVYGKYEHRIVFDSKSKWNDEVDYLRGSELFDADWYLLNNPDVRESGMDPVLHYYFHGASEGRDPSVSFCSNEYSEIHRDVKASHINPLCHYEQYGRLQGRETSYLQIRRDRSHHVTESLEQSFEVSPCLHRRTAIVSARLKNRRIERSLLYLLKQLKAVCDNIVLAGDRYIEEAEAQKLEGLVCYASFKDHDLHHYGSYRTAYAYARRNGLLEKEICDELIMTNDSNYGPIFPFEESFDYIKDLSHDYWVYRYNPVNNAWNIDSSFCVFGEKILRSRLLDEFFNRVREREDLIDIDPYFEEKLSFVLESQNLVSASLVSKKDQAMISEEDHELLINDYRIPLLKKETVKNESPKAGQLRQLIFQNNADLYEALDTEEIKKSVLPDMKQQYRADLEKRAEKIAHKLKNGQKIIAKYLVFDASIFAARPLFEKMKEDASFDPQIVVIPDIRFGEADLLSMDRCEKELLDSYPKRYVRKLQADYCGIWPDVLCDADIVCYPSPYNVSYYNYNVRYALESRFLPIIVNYGFSSTKYDYDLFSFQNYAYFWKVFLENESTYEEYKRRSSCPDDNAELIGYVKMDALYDAQRHDSERKRVLVAMHHSIDEGFNDSLSLSNFLRYSAYFEKLPDRYPQIDFVFRPHPFLRKALERDRKWGKKKLDAYIERICRKKNASWKEDGDYFTDFADSDGCIQDCGSFLVEYMYADKPCCYMLKDEKDIDDKFSELGKQCLEHCYLSYTAKQIDSFIEQVIIKDNDEKKSDREEFMKRIMVNYPHSSETALKIIRRSLLHEQG